ncbi:hypothetical protein H1R20_g12341, partial [Candolleomyces eurysporus]
MYNHNWYNNLLIVKEADNAFTEREQIFKKIAPLLARPEFRGKYNLCLVHRHVILEPGERMVATGLISQPETLPDPTPSDIVPSSWAATGVPFEWTRIKAAEDIIAPPPADLFREFSEIVGEGSLLGLSLALDPVPEGQIWSEHVDHDKRQHILEVKPVAGPWGEQDKLFETSWTPKPSGGQAEPSLVFAVTCVCNVCVTVDEVVSQNA